MLLQMGPLLRLGPNVITDMETLLHLGAIITLVPSTGPHILDRRLNKTVARSNCSIWKG